jgi:hypothetical protein
MLERCNPQMVENVHSQARSWRKAARALNELYSVSLSHTAWRDYAIGRHDIADSETRTRLMLPLRACPSCGHKHVASKTTKPKKIREYGYQIEKIKSMVEVLELHHAPR